jgi:agmatine deiminase
MTKSIIIPAEWEDQAAIWTCWPSAADLWQEDLEGARAEVGAMINALITPHNGKYSPVKLLVATDEAYQSATQILPSNVEIFKIPFGDIWLRDTGPIFAKSDNQEIALCLGFNGWGGKYVLEFDNQVNVKLCEIAQVAKEEIDFVFEGGSVDGNGAGVFLTTTQCLLNKNRNPNLSQADIENIMREKFGAKLILWLEDGLLNDHTDGHIDNIARFIGENTIICQSPFGDDDPNIQVLDKIYNDLCAMKNLDGKNFEIIRAPSPGLVKNYDDEIIPASHMNFIIGNGAIVMPHYGTKSADEALRILAQCFPNHKIVGINATSVLTGGGSFHCITQQQPK